MSENKTPLLSICSTTYNLEKYIAIALDSWLAQKVNFDFEIVICDDASTDNTIKIIEKYKEKYPEKIRLVPAEFNQGMLPNFIKSLKEARGKYIAVCDGDDYWIDNDKLQVQIDFLETHTDYVACLTNSYVLNELTQEKIIAKKYIWDTANVEELFFHNDFLEDNVDLSPGHISTYVFRNGLLDEYPDWFYKIDGVTDFPLYVINSIFGPTKFINKITSVYRVHPKSSSTNDYSYYRVQKGRINIFVNLDSYLQKKHTKSISKLISRHYINIFKYFKRNKKIISATRALIDSYYYNSSELYNYFFAKIRNRFNKY